MSRPARACVDLDALRSNLSLARQTAPDSRVMAVVKANGYGHGMVQAATALQQADGFGVACLEEAVQLRDAGITPPITLLEGAFHADELETISRLQLATVIHSRHQLEALAAAALPRPVAVWLKLDTGMHRLGFAPTELGEVHARLQAMPQVASLGLMSHFACADDREDSATQRQLDVFSAAVGEYPGERSLANSGALLGWQASHGDWVRPGLMLYGISPFVDTSAEAHGLRPAMTLETELIAINEFQAGAAVGYGGSWVCPERMRIGVAAIGYGDGYPRHAVTGTPVLIDGQHTHIVGRVSMDMICIDLRPLPQARIGSRVTLWGKGLPVELVARHADTIPYELVCAVSSRVPFLYSD